MRAHATGLSYLDLTLDGSTLRAVLDLPAADLSQGLLLDSDRNGEVSPDEVTEHDAVLQGWLAANLAIAADGQDCHPTTGPSELRNGILKLRGQYECPVSFTRLTLRSSLGQAIGTGAATFVELHRPSVASERTLLSGGDGSYTFVLNASGSRWKTAVEFIELGVDHIFHGYDHILFLLALLMLCETLRSMVGLATAFTVAHTLTLSLAATKTLVLPTRFTESAIAASIAWVAVENWLYAPPRLPGQPLPFGIRFRWLLTFSFGLVHGFGFASALAERGLPAQSVPLALGCFNLGVEVGQIAIIALAYPLLRRARAIDRYRPQGVRFASVGIFGLAIYWFVQRAFLP